MSPHLQMLAVAPLVEIGRSLREAFAMFWATLWALVLGFGLSGAVQAFVSREAMKRRLGDHRPTSVARAAAYGMVSSSCSYAASALARSLVARGADYLAAMVFMIASTNLVLELGIVLAVLIGWQFVAAEFVGGTVMIVLLVVVGGLAFRGRALARARQHVVAAGADPGVAGDSHSRPRIRTAAGWADAASYTMSDLAMLRKELVAGFLAAGFITVLVPHWVWAALFLRGHGAWTTLENAAVGPLVALLSFVCSVGNVPLAAALWSGGISFGGVVAFVFADLITLPLLLIYRRQYGGRMALRMLAAFWFAMSAAGLLTEYLFRALGWLPGGRAHTVVASAFQWDATTGLNIAALAVFALLFALYRSRERLGGGIGYGKDPVCGMQVDTAHAPARTVHAGTTVYFCSDHCLERFRSSPGRYAPSREDDVTPQAVNRVDPVCGSSVSPGDAVLRDHAGEAFALCSPACAAAFDEEPERYLQAVTRDPVCGQAVAIWRSPARTRYQGTPYAFCSTECRSAFLAHPRAYLSESSTP